MERFNPMPFTATEMAISDMMWEGGPSIPAEPAVKNSQFPERRGRIRLDCDPTLRGAEELAMVTGRIERVEPT